MSLSNRPKLFAERLAGNAAGITSVCTAHPLAIEAAFRVGLEAGTPVLIEATCNQVNQDGGYTGMTPADFRRFVEEIAERTGFDPARIVFGGDHLGPNPWKHLPAEEAMAKAEAMIAAYATAGFAKLHLDTSMGCAGEAGSLSEETVAGRAARLAAAAEKTSTVEDGPIYVIGTEVPTPGGAVAAHEAIEVTKPANATHTVEIHRAAFERLGLLSAFERAVAVVVQPGVEFGDANVDRYEPPRAAELVAALPRLPQFVFEAHSTDYQSGEALASLVADGFAILKVGPELTFALREALYGLDAIAAIVVPDDAETLPAAMERVMLARPQYWDGYYKGATETERHMQRHYSLSDRIRYYWPQPEADAAVKALLDRLGDRTIPLPLVGQFLGKLELGIVEGRIRPIARDLLVASVEEVLRRYGRACGTL